MAIAGERWSRRQESRETLRSTATGASRTGNKLFLVLRWAPRLHSYQRKEAKNHERAIVIVEGSEAANQVDEVLTFMRSALHLRVLQRKRDAEILTN